MWHLLLGLWGTAGDQTLALLFVPHVLGWCNNAEGGRVLENIYMGESSDFSNSNATPQQQNVVFK